VGARFLGLCRRRHPAIANRLLTPARYPQACTPAEAGAQLGRPVWVITNLHPTGPRPPPECVGHVQCSRAGGSPGSRTPRDVVLLGSGFPPSREHWRGTTSRGFAASRLRRSASGMCSAPAQAGAQGHVCHETLFCLALGSRLRGNTEGGDIAGSRGPPASAGVRRAFGVLPRRREPRVTYATRRYFAWLWVPAFTGTLGGGGIAGLRRTPGKWRGRHRLRSETCLGGHPSGL